MTGAFALDQSVVHLVDTGHIGRATNDPSFWDRRDRPELHSGHVLSVFHYDTTWDHQERHPQGDELVALLDGDVDLLLASGAGETPVRLHRHFAYIIGAGTWHRVAPRRPSTLLFVTPVPARTDHRPVGDRTP